jgi:hypothetical protein
MRSILLASTLASGLALAACDYNKSDYNEANAAYDEGNADYNGAAAGGYDTAAASSWPEGARIVEEEGVYYRIDPGGTRVRLEPGTSTIVVENGVRYRVDPGGTRVRIDEEGAVISVGPDGVDTTVPVGENTSVTVNSN